MPLIVVVDANVVLAAVLDPRMDAKAEQASDVFRTLADAGIRPAITESLHDEVETKMRQRVGQLVDALRDLANGPPPIALNSGPSAFEVLETLFSKLRRQTPESAGALQVLETRIVAVIADQPVTTEAHWQVMLRGIAMESASMLAEVQRKHDALGLDVLPRPGKVDRGPFESFVPKSDIEHIAFMAAVAQARRSRVVFVTMDSALHGIREEIEKAAPNVTVTMPAYLRRSIARPHPSD